MKLLNYLLSLIVIFSIIFLYTNYKKPPEKKDFIYLKFRSIVISNINLAKNSTIFKQYLFLKGKSEQKKIFTEKIFKKHLTTLREELLIDKQKILISNISLEELKIKISANLKKVTDKESSYYKRLEETTKFNLSEPLDGYEILNVKFGNFNSYGILEKKDNKKLIIYNQGHLGNPYNKKYFLEVKKYFQNKGYDFLILNMFGRGINFQGDVEYKNTLNKFKLNTYHHDNIKYFKNKKYKNKNPLSIILSGNYYLIDHVLNSNQYDEINFFGVSGGGWYGLFLSPLFEEIKNTFVFNGNVPRYLMNFIDTKGDWKTFDNEIYDRIDYWTLYKMTYKNPTNFNKKLYLVYNTKDKCCFRNPSASVIKKFEKYINNERFIVKLYEREKFHGLDLETVINLMY